MILCRSMSVILPLIGELFSYVAPRSALLIALPTFTQAQAQ